MRTVPTRMKEAAVGIGCTPTQVVCRRWCCSSAALPGILTGPASAGSRVSPANRHRCCSRRRQQLLAVEPVRATASLPILIYNFSSMPFPNQIGFAWAASLVLVLIVLFFNILARLVGRPKV